MPSEMLLLRHPETEANTSGRWVGRGDSPFTELGLEQVDLLAEEMIRFSPEAVFASPLERTRVPAQKAAAALGIEVVFDERLIELHFGEAEGLTTEEAAESGITFEFMAEDHPVAPGGESRREILLRTTEFLDEIRGARSRAAVVTHGGVFRSAMVATLDLPIHAIWAFHIRNAQVARISYGADWARLEEFRQAGRTTL